MYKHHLGDRYGRWGDHRGHTAREGDEGAADIARMPT